MNARDPVQFNAQAHDRVSSTYDRVHGEIFNPIEQARLRGTLSRAVAAVQTGSPSTPMALDYGCGSGNLTRHLISLGLRTVSADVSERFLAMIREQFATTGMSSTLKINGRDLSGVPEGRFDLVATYSVLHHVQDYLHIVEEMCRVLRPGGVLYIDHEVTDTYYDRPAAYVEFLKKARPAVNWRRGVRLLLDVPGYIHILRRLRNPRYKREGDIHVWPDDRIEWNRIEQVLAQHRFETVLKQDYLVCTNLYNLEIYQQYKDKVADQRLLIARKMRSAG
jgi:ubiquinone/menaquinone biosynthesis C-methylase UbiE